MDIRDYRFYQTLIEQPFVEAVWLYGSRARRDHQARADIDLAIFCPKANFEDWNRLEEIIERADTLLKIDFVRLDELPSDSNLKAAILKEGIKVYEKSYKKTI